MRIENLGLPGSGKSTLAKACRSVLNDAGRKAVDTSGLHKLDIRHPPGHRRLWRNEKFRQSQHIARYLTDHTAMHAFFDAHYGSNFRNIAFALGIGADLSRSNMHKDHFETFWVDEGFLHLGAHALLEATGWILEDCKAKLNGFMDVLPRPDLVLYPLATVGTATEGIFARMSGRSPEQARERFDTVFGGTKGMQVRAQLIALMVHRLEADGVPMITVTAHGDLDDLCAEVVAKITPHLVARPD